MSTRKKSGGPADPGAGPDRRAFLEKALAASGLILLPPGAQALGSMPSGGGQAVNSNNPIVPSTSVMAAAAEAFYNSLGSDQRAKVRFALDDAERLNWHFVPRARKGLSYKDLDPAQRQLANALMSSGLSPRGFVKAATIMSLESILREQEQGGGPVRDAELYYFTLFGEPGSERPWGWRVEGHHISLNLTIADLKTVASTPSFLGCNPAEVLHGPRKGLRTLPAEEDLARALLKSLDAAQRTQAVVSENAPKDILTGNARKAEPQKPAGLVAGKLKPNQSEMLMRLIQEYAAAMSHDIATARLEKLRAAGFEKIAFAWAGGAEHGQPHYYRIQGPTFLVEYDNIQHNANHIHTVWRDFNGDFGLDLLALHHKAAHK